MSERAVPFKSYTAECTTYRCAKYLYKTAIDKDDIQLHCTKCGTALAVKEAKE